MASYNEVNVTVSPEREYHPSSGQVWGYGFLFVTIINLGAFAGVWVIPLMDKKMYKNVLMFLVSLAVGTLAGNALFSLIPESQGIFIDDAGMDYIWKNMVVLSGIYLFFNTERLLKIIASRRRERARLVRSGNIYEGERRGSRRPSVQVTAMHNIDFNPDRIGYKFTSPTEAMAMTDAKENSQETNKGRNENTEAMEEGKGLLYSSPSEDIDKKFCSKSPRTSCASVIYRRDSENNDIDRKPDGNLANGDPGCKIPQNGGPPHGNEEPHGHGHGHVVVDADNMIATVAYMIIFGDGLHNFIDGLAIGASFTDSIYQGISTSVAVICEEFPHELGDFAILLNSGMSVKQAVLANFLSALTCYLGLVVGIVLGESFHSSEWIFALAGGMFLYIALVDMLPEINNVGEEDPLHEDQRSFKIFFIQNAGLLCGFALMLVLALFAGRIQV